MRGRKAGGPKARPAPRPKAGWGARFIPLALLPPKPPRVSVPGEVAQRRARPLAALSARWGQARSGRPGCSPSPSPRAPSPGPEPPRASLSPSLPSLPARPCLRLLRPQPPSAPSPLWEPERREGAAGPLPSALTAGSGAPCPVPRRRDTPRPSSAPPVPAGPTGRRRERAGERELRRRGREGARQAHGGAPGRTEPACPSEQPRPAAVPVGLGSLGSGAPA